MKSFDESFVTLSTIKASSNVTDPKCILKGRGFNILHLNDKVAIVTAAADEIKANGGEVTFITVDISIEEEVKNLVEKTSGNV